MVGASRARDVRPVCPVCKTHYHGEDVTPGIFSFILFVGGDVMIQGLRSFALVFVLVAYWGVSQDYVPWPWNQIVLFTLGV